MLPIPAHTQLALLSRFIKSHLIPLNPTMGMVSHKVNKEDSEEAMLPISEL